MFSRFKIALGLSLLLALVFAIPVFAGGWAVITLDEIPTNVTAGEDFTIGFTVLQHGKTPMTDLEPTVTANLGSEKFVVKAKEEGKPGHYTATLNFPNEGDWNWMIEAFSMQQKLPTLSVAPSSSVASEPATVTETKSQINISPTLFASILTLAVGLVSLFVAFQRKSKIAATLTALCLMAGFALSMAESNTPKVEAQSESSSSEVIQPSSSLVEYGRDLFIAKGCITCHYNTKAASRSEYWTIEMGAPDLSKFSADPLILEMRLKDPTSVKSDSQMPQLDLTKEEIDALIAFINSN